MSQISKQLLVPAIMLFTILNATQLTSSLGYALSVGKMKEKLNPSKIAKIVQTTEVKSFRLYGWEKFDIDIIKAILSRVPEATFVIEIPPHQVNGCAENYDFCFSLLQQYEGLPPNAVKYIAIGNEPYHAGKKEMDFSKIPAAIENAAKAQASLGFNAGVTVPFSMHAFLSTYPVYTGCFHEPSGEVSKRNGMFYDILSMIQKYNGVFAFHPYPYFVANGDPSKLNECLDVKKMLHSQIRAARYALNSLKFENMPMIITEIGWPTSGNNKAVANGLNAAKFFGSLSDAIEEDFFGTVELEDGSIALGVLDIYAFEMFDEKEKEGSPDEKHFGWFTESGKKKYNYARCCLCAHRKRKTFA